MPKSEGHVYHIGETEVVSDKFSKRDFVIEVADENPQTGEMYTHFEAFQLTNKNTSIADGFKIGDEVSVWFGIRSNKLEKDGITKFFTNLTAGRVELIKCVPNNRASNATQQQVPQHQNPGFNNTKNVMNDSDLPF